MATNETTVTEKNPYAYLDRDDFTSEKYKIEVRGLPNYYGIAELKKFLNEKLELQAHKVKPVTVHRNDWLFVSFNSEESRQKAIQTLNGIVWKKCELRAQNAKPAKDPFVKRILQEEKTNKRLKLDENDLSISEADKVKSTTIPLWNTPYEKQLELKQKEMRSILRNICTKMLVESRDDLIEWLDYQKNKYEGLPCELLPLLSTDKITEYRNKCEFTVGRSNDGDKVTVGFRLSSYAAGSTAVGPIDDLCHIPMKMRTVAKVLEEFIENSQLSPFQPVDHSGYWRQVTVRTSLSGNLMVIVGMHPQDLSSERLEELRSQLKDFFETGKGATAGVTSLYFQTMNKNVNGENGDKLYHISGTKYIEETLLGMKFRVSPQAFFQVNTLGAEVLYKAAIDLAKPTKDTALLDICCGTGTIGLVFSKHCGEVFGLEMMEDAIKDARENVVANNVTNCEFFVGKAEDILSPVIQRTTKSDIIAVVDPPRAGLHQRALLTLRKAKKLSRLVYVSCDPRAAARNLVDLARPTSKRYIGEPLVPVKAVAVDMFPYTKHCELVLCLERLSIAMKARDST